MCRYLSLLFFRLNPDSILPVGIINIKLLPYQHKIQIQKTFRYLKGSYSLKFISESSCSLSSTFTKDVIHVQPDLMDPLLNCQIRTHNPLHIMTI